MQSVLDDPSKFKDDEPESIVPKGSDTQEFESK